jgi:hypothetical protein
MAKLVVLVKGSPDEGFAQWYLKEFAPHKADGARGVCKWTVSVVDILETPGRISWAHPTNAAPGFDIVSEIWGDAAACAAIHADGTFARRATALSYSVEESVEKGALNPVQTPGIKVIGCVLPVAGNSSEQTRAHWDAHVPLALDVHVGICRYVRNWVIASEAGQPGFFGFPMLYFPTEADYRDRYFGPGDARQRHAADIGQFVGGGAKLVTTEHAVALGSG